MKGYQVIADEIPRGAMSRQDLYGDCPEYFDNLKEAEKWAEKLSMSGYWPDGQVTYHVETV